MAVNVITPVSVTVSAATAGALNTATAAAVTAAKAASGYLTNSVEIYPAFGSISAQDTSTLYQTIVYKTLTEPA